MYRLRVQGLPRPPRAATPVVLAMLACASAAAQQPPGGSAPAQPPAPARTVPSPEQLEPAVDTSHTALTPGAQSQEAAPQTNTGSAPAPSAAAPAPAPAKAKAAASAARTAAKQPKAKGPDRLELDTSEVRANRELPKVMYIVPWKRSDLGDLVGRPPKSLLDEVLQPLDRDVFQRQNRYYDALKPTETGTRATAAQGDGVKP
jgi:hypothetical protein